VFEANRGEPSGVDESTVTVQCQGSGPVGVDDHGDDFADTRARAFGEQLVQEPPADPAADRIGCDVDRVLHGVAIGGSGFPRCAVGISGDPAAQRCGQERQSAIRGGPQPAQPFHLIGRGELERRDAGLHVLGVDPADVIDVVRNGTPDRDIALAHNAFRAISRRQGVTRSTESRRGSGSGGWRPSGTRCSE